MPDIFLHRETKYAQYFTESFGDTLELDMIFISDGKFIMGSPNHELERNSNEGPQHEVVVSSFFMGRYPVTQAQWRFVATLPQVNQTLDPDTARFKGDNLPVESVNWYDAVEFCARLSIFTSRDYRLPSEAEWEYACGAGTTTPFYFGQILTTEIANFNGKFSYNNSPKGEYRDTTTPVDYFGIANAFGLCDMHGNVVEWCQDNYQDSYERAPIDGSPWLDETISNDNIGRIARGGAWVNKLSGCRSAARYHYPSREPKYIDTGFRLACSLPKNFV